MNEDTIQQVGKLTDVNPNDLKKKGLKKKISLVYYYLIQFGFFVFSSLVGMGFGLYSNAISFYPYSAFPQRYIYGSIILAITHGGNLGLSYQLSRKKRLVLSRNKPKVLSPFYIYPAIVLNIILSTISLFVVHNIVVNGSPVTMNTFYGVYVNKKLNIRNLNRTKNTEI